jgi:hypothetical protein
MRDRDSENDDGSMADFSAIAVAHSPNHKRSLGKRTIGF